LIPNLHGSVLESESVPSLSNVIIVDNSSGRFETATGQKIRATSQYEDVLEDGGAGKALEEQGLNADEVVNIQFTSGTTSMPKAAMLTHRNILNNGNSIGDRMLLTPDDIVVCPPPLFHCFGCILGYMATATHASSIVFPTESFDPSATLKAVQEYSATALYGVPTMFIAELELLASGTIPRTGLNHLRTGIAAGSSIPAELMRKLHRELNLTELTICYGMTETSPVSAMTTTDDPLDKRIDSVGRLLPHVRAKVVDPSNWSRILGVGERGELAVSGYLVMKGYWGDERRSAEVLVPDDEGVVWMHVSSSYLFSPSSPSFIIWHFADSQILQTGDEASIDADGYVRITGRIKDLIIKGGENIHPLEIENCLLSHPSISEVSVVGLPNERYGEVVAAFVIPRQGLKLKNEKEQEIGKKKDVVDLLTTQEVRDWVLKNLSHHLVPKYVFWVDEYPKTASGKIQKFKLREIGMEMVDEGKGL
jgi:acyl-CoA synthetase (AMP-forming)/AMP-acid ligase II